MIITIQKQNRELGKENQKLQTDVRIAERKASQATSEVSRHVSPPPRVRLNKDEQMEVRELQQKISDLNNKITQMKSEFEEERIMAQSKIFEIMKTSNGNHRQLAADDHDKENSKLYLQTANSMSLGEGSELGESLSKYGTMKKSSEKIKISDAHFLQDQVQDGEIEHLRQ